MTFLYSLLGIPFGYVMWAIYQIIPSYGVSIILFTLFTKLILIPISVKQQKNSAKTALLGPKLEKIKKQYGKNQQRYQEEVQKLYEREGANPMAGCFPMIIQFLILFGIYDVVCKPLKHILHLSNDIIVKFTDIVNTAAKAANGGKELFSSGSLQSQIHAFNYYKAHTGDFGDLASQIGQEAVDKLNGFSLSFLGINLGETPSLAFNMLLLIPILSGVTALISSIVSTKINEKNNPAMQGNTTMKSMALIMPIFSAWIAFSVPAGVGFYWAVSNVFIIVQTIVLAKIYTPEKLKAYAEAEAEKRRQSRGVYTSTAEVVDEETGEIKEVTETKQLSDSEKIALARKRMEEKYGE